MIAVRYCRECNQAFAYAVTRCPGCGHDTPTFDAFELIETLGKGAVDEEAEARELERITEAAG